MAVIAAFAVPHPPLILPEVGKGDERRIQATANAYRRVMRRAAELKPDTIVVISPHCASYADYFHISPGDGASGSFVRFGAPAIKIDTFYDDALRNMVIKLCEHEGIPAGTLGERISNLDHGTMIPLSFLNECCADFRTLRIGVSGLSALEHYRLGMCVAAAADKLDRRVVVVASGDLSHKLSENGTYGYSPEGAHFDKLVAEALDKADFPALLRMEKSLCESAGECGLRSLQIMAGSLDGKSVHGGLYSYEAPFGVGYAVAAFEATGADTRRRYGALIEKQLREERGIRLSNEDEYIRLARLSAENYVRKDSETPLPDCLSDELVNRRAGVFVSVKKDGKLRGCIGTMAPTAESLAREIMTNALRAVSSDPRFPPVTPDELDKLSYSVDVLSDAERISGTAQLDVRRYGVIVKNGNRIGLLLPELEGVDTPAVQVAIAKQKAGINRDEPVDMWRFEVTRHR